VQVLGRMMNLTPVTTTMKLAMPLASVSWVDDEASPVVITVNLGGIEIKMFRSTKEDALGESDAPEMFVQTFVPVERRITQSAKRVKIRMRLPADSPDKLPPIPDTTMQSVRRVNDREAVVTIRRVDWKSLANVGDNPPPKDMAEFLKASTILDIDNRRIKRLARRAIKGVSTPSERADALRRFVTKYITDKSLDVGFATASEVAQTREGDCTEHGVLLAALARAAGIPARGVSGIIQIPAGPFAPSKGSAFGYHMWTQVNIGGRWIDLDAAMRQTDCDPTHIALSLMPLNEEGMVESVLALLPLLGKLQIEVIEVE
ncbi:MAG: transglutaminase-like domain-containing protein, partial [Planctomycetota bacterium]|nr:transglutaminase-like domain-containing protein [Planctomycetota bacterium]